MPLKVYYVDDEQDLTAIFAEFLESPDLEIRTFNDPLVALAIIEKDPPDLLFLGMQMPKMSGLELAQQLAPQIPKILMTGNIEIAASPGFQAVFHKPYRFPVIQEYIDGLLKQRLSA